MMNIFQNSFSKKPIALTLVFTIGCLTMGPALLLPRQSQATDSVVVLSSVTGLLQTILQAGWQAVNAVADQVQTGLLQSQTMASLWDKAKKIAEWAEGTLLNLLLHRILAMLTNDIVNWIQNGGELRFMSEGLGSFLGRAADNVLGDFIANYLGAGFLCDSFEPNLKIALSSVPAFETDNVECTLTDIRDNLKGFYNDFSQGGWAGWIELTQSKGNFYSNFLVAKGARDRQILEAKQELEADALMGDGFLSQKNCTWYDANGNVVEEQEDVRGYPNLPEVCRGDGVDRPCRPVCHAVNPGQTISQAASKSVTNFYDQINAQIAGATAKAGPYQVYVQAIANALINRVINEGFALFTGEGSVSESGYQTSVPNYGDKGYSANIPEIANPESVVQEKEGATGTKSQLGLIKQNLENDLLDEQKENLAILKSIQSVYQETIPVLDEIIESCAETNYSGYISWAQTQKDEINNSFIPSLNQRINELESDSTPETLDIVSVEGTIETANFIPSTVIPAIDNYQDKAEEWLEAYEQVEGKSESSELTAVETAMDQAEADAISQAQEAIKAVNGSFSSNDFTGLEQEAQTANIAINDIVTNLWEERGNPDFPEAGTLYAELETAESLKKSADNRLNQCLLYSE